MSEARIGFSQRIKLEWLERTASLYLLGSSRDQIEQILQDLLSEQLSVGGTAERGTREKVITILLRTWITVPVELRQLRDEGVEYLQRLPPPYHLVLHWGMCMATYPFFGAVADSTGRLLRLQGTVGAAQVQRRLREQLGERETVARAARRVLRSFIDWSVLTETARKGAYRAAPQHSIEDPRLTAWLLEAALRSRGADVASLHLLAQWPALFPFSIDAVPRKDIEHSGRLELFRQGVAEEMVLLRAGR